MQNQGVQVRIITGHSLLEALCCRVLESLHPVDGPEVGGQGRVAHVLVGHVEVALVTPPESQFKDSQQSFWDLSLNRTPEHAHGQLGSGGGPLSPGVADDEALLEVVVAHGAHGMTA